MKHSTKTGPSAAHAPAGVPALRSARPPAKHPRRAAVWRGVVRLHWIILGIVAVLLVIRLILPFAVKRYVNHQLNTAKDYGGGVGAVHMQLWRGQYRIDNLKIFKRNGEVQTPLFSTDNLNLSIEWPELFHGSVVGEVRADRPRVNIVSGPTTNQTQTGTNEGWAGILSSLFPFDLNKLQINDGEIHFQNEYSKPPVDIYISKLYATATNLNNSRKIKTGLPAGVTASATTIGGGGLSLQLQLNPMTAAPTYQIEASLTNVDLPALNSFLKAYGKFDVERGKFSLYASVAGKDSAYDGYLKVFFNDLDVFAWEKEKKKNAVAIFWEAIVGTLTTAFKNQPHDSLATRIAISGSYKDQKISVLPAVGTLLRNAFVRSLVPKMDEKVTVENVEQKTEEKKKMQETPIDQKGAQKINKPAS